MTEPWVQVAIDVRETQQAKGLAKMAIEAGADWIEAGTPLIVFEGTRSIGSLVQVCGSIPVVADFKAQDGVAKYFLEAKRQGASAAVILGFVADGSIKAAVSVGKTAGIKVIADMYSVKRRHLAQRAKELESLGVDYLMLHLGFDEAKDEPDKSPLDGLEELLHAVSIPVGVGTFTVEEAVEAVTKGASWIVQGEPIVSGPNAAARLSEFIAAVKQAERPRR
jgi:3-hexulose-6-phosphate synthase